MCDRTRQIEQKARLLLNEIRQNAGTLWPNTPPPLLYMCEPSKACEVLGLKYQPDRHLGVYGSGTAGMLDRDLKVVAVSYLPPYVTQRFTAAHEIGHYLLHEGRAQFRDRPVGDQGLVDRPPMEQEADRFAACFLMPFKLLTAEFEARFGTRRPLPQTSTVCYALSPRNHQELERAPTGSLDFARAVARAQSFGGKAFSKSLASLFNVSVTAMAIRLQEVGLVA